VLLSIIYFGQSIFLPGGIINAILAEQFDVEEDKITADTDLQEDLGADSLDVVDLLMSIEDEFEVEVPDEEIENIKTVGSLVSYIEANS
jgi:acyl carrier protein